MLKIIVKITILSVFIVCQSCSNSIPEIKISDISFEMSIDTNAFAGLRAFGEKTDKSIKKLEENEAYKDANLQVISESSSEGDHSSTLELSFQFDKTMDSTQEELKKLGKEAFQVVINILQSSEPYDKYEIKFLKNANADREDANNFRAFVYTINELE